MGKKEKIFYKLLYFIILLSISFFIIIIALGLINKFFSVGIDNVPLVNNWPIKNIIDLIYSHANNTLSNRIGTTFVVSGSGILLAYSSFLIVISKIPIIGSIIKFLTGGIMFISVLSIIFGSLTLYYGFLG